jgi:copper homeostasis protein CutC
MKALELTSDAVKSMEYLSYLSVYRLLTEGGFTG